MRKILMILIAAMLPICLLAQAEMEDVIYMKDGSILRGEIVERNGDESIKIEITGRNLMVVFMEDVDEIKREEIPTSDYYKKEGFINYTGLDILPGDYNATTLRYQMVNGYQFDPYVSAGIGIGFTSYNDPLNAVPVFLEMRVKFHKSSSSPFIFFKGGYNFSLSPDSEFPLEDHRGGYLLNPGIGIQFENKDSFGWYFTAGFNVDHLVYEEEDWEGPIRETDIKYKRIHFGFGLVF